MRVIKVIANYLSDRIGNFVSLKLLRKALYIFAE
jgi:hypothetical protein